MSSDHIDKTKALMLVQLADALYKDGIFLLDWDYEKYQELDIFLTFVGDTLRYQQRRDFIKLFTLKNMPNIKRNLKFLDRL